MERWCSLKMSCFRPKGYRVRFCGYIEWYKMTEDICERFNKFLKGRKDGVHYFRGKLRDCYAEQRVETQGRKIFAFELAYECSWPDNHMVKVYIEGEVNEKKQGEFIFDETCF
ncbi:toxin of RelE/StbE family [Marseillevirus marseillevirus]|uniref:Toxin of RelE/StbE family n=1 Tax=Marseillevirus marseillevirus TaxID=694581 RepID=D2XAA6_GBMV|nr:toxin of RelE/StbE family [Marseillevirus marseillevirus]YP_009094585.1 putative RelE/StbE family toxin [Melbournevirus]ADB03883.1 toxin of RelE/StbE family [Marseillevirus marseillevirus]AIT54697.1 hypothetical protein MEL_084 [Melbournevirus]